MKQTSTWPATSNVMSSSRSAASVMPAPSSSRATSRLSNRSCEEHTETVSSMRSSNEKD